MTAAPGGFFVVKPLDKSAFDVQHIQVGAPLPDEFDYDLVEQVRKQVFIGDHFCFDKLSSQKDARFAALKDKNFENSEYMIDFSYPDYIDVELMKSKKPGMN